MVLGLNLSSTINNAVTEVTTNIKQSSDSEMKTKINKIADSTAEVNVKYGEHSVTNCAGNLIISADAKTLSKLILGITMNDKTNFENLLKTKIKKDIDTEIKQKNDAGWFGVGDENISSTITNSVDSATTNIAQEIVSSMSTMVKQEDTSGAKINLEFDGTMNVGGDCIINAKALTESFTKAVISKMNKAILTNTVVSDFETQITTKVTQDNSMPMWIMILCAVGVVGGGMSYGGSGSASMGGAILLLLCAIGLGILLIPALGVIDIKKCKDGDSWIDYVVKEECVEKDDDEKKKDECLECKNGTKIVKKPFESIWWISCFIGCCVCALLSVILFAVYASSDSSPSSMPSGSLQEHQNQTGGGKTLFKIFERYFKKL